MAEAAKAGKISRKDLKQPDAFVESVGTFTTYYREHRTTVIVGAVVAASIFIGTVAVTGYQRRASANAAAAFFRGTEAMSQNSMEAAKTGFANLAETGTRPYNNLAKLYGAELAVQESRYDDAIVLYEAFVASISTPYLKQVGLVGLGYAHEQAGHPKQALESYTAAAQIEGPHREQALRDQLRTADVVGNAGAAKDAIRKLLEFYPGSPDAESLSERLNAAS